MVKLLNRNGASIFIIFLAWLFIVFPSTLGAKWFYLDMPTSISIGKDIFNSFGWLNPNANTERYLPSYWLYQGLGYLISGAQPFGYFLIQSIVSLACAILVFMIANKLTKNKWVGVLAVLLFLTGSPMAENVFTIGKPEQLVLFLMLLCVWLFLTNAAHKRQYITFTSIVVITAISVWAKETAMVIISFGVICTLLSYVFVKEASVTKKLGVLTLANIAGVLLARLPYFLRESSAESNYTGSYTITFKLIQDNFLFYLKQQPDIFIIGLALFPFLFYLLLTMKNKSLDDKLFVIYTIGLYVISWGYICGLLIWRWPFGYYLFISSCLFNLLAAVVIFKFIRKPKPSFIATVIFILLILLSKVYSIPYNYYVATTQKSMDKVYSDAIEQYMKLSKDGQRLFVEQWSSYDEQVFQSNRLLKILNKKGSEVVGVADLFNSTQLSEETKALYQIKDRPDKSERKPNVGDFVLVITGNKTAYWNLRGVAPFNNNESKFMNMGWDLQLSASDQINRSLIYMDAQGTPKYGSTYLGYQLYKVTGEGVSWVGRTTDYWIGKTAECSFLFDTTSQRFKITVPDVYLPNKLSILSNNELIKEVELKNAGELDLLFELKSHIGETVNLQFVVEKTFIPKQLGINEDDRELGIQIKKIKK